MAVNACLAPVASMHGLAVTTVEGIGNTVTKLHPVQERIAKAHGSQCGFCTPGIVMSMYTLLRNSPKPKMADLEVTLQGNLCRCTGYRPILEGFKTFTEDYELMQTNGMISQQNGNGCAMGDQCCKVKKTNVLNGDKEEAETLFKSSEFVPYDSSQEPIFPPELKINDAFDKEVLLFKGRNTNWYRPTSLSQLLQLKEEHPEAKIVVGNTEIGVEVKFKHLTYPVLIHPNEVPEMVKITVTEKGVKFGASVTLQNMENALKKQINENPLYKTRIYQQIVDMLHWFAGRQIRNVASIGGNIMTGSPISDLNPIFIAANVELELRNKTGVRIVNFNDKFFTGYRRNIVKPDEILVSVLIPYTKENQYFYAYKQARRRDDDIAIVNSAINVILNEKINSIEYINLAFGGMAPTTVSAPKTSQALVGLPWNKETLEKAFDNLMEDLPLAPDAPGGMINYRRSLTLSFFLRAYLTICKEVNNNVDPKELSGIKGFKSKIPKSSQYFSIAKNGTDIDTVGLPTVHVSAFKQATGEAIYVDDMPKFENEVYMALVTSSKSHANIKTIDPSEALKMKGVHAFFCAKDIDKEHNKCGPVFHDEEIFISKTVTSQGQTIGIILADDQIIAQEAARKVKIEYEELQPILVSIEDAIKHNSFFPLTKQIVNGDVENVFKEAPHIIEGECKTGGQEQFYFETQCVVVNPKKEDCEMEIYSSTQHPTEVAVSIQGYLNLLFSGLVKKSLLFFYR